MKKEIRYIFLSSLLVLAGWIIGFSHFSKITPIPLVSLITPISLNTPIGSSSAVFPTSDSATFARVTRVFDGDTIEIEGGQKVRYIGIDAAEIYPTSQCFSNESLAKNKELVLGKAVRLEKDVSETDKYGRLLRFVYIGDIFVNNELTKEGYTKVMTVPPDIKYMDQFTQSEKYAKGNNLGLWSKCL